MWFKTRVGLYSIHEPLEIRVAEYSNEGRLHYSVFARSLGNQDFQYEGRLGRVKGSNPTSYLAMFNSDSAKADLACCMQLIEEAIRTEAKMCDLSAIGDPGAWNPQWNLIEWEEQK